MRYALIEGGVVVNIIYLSQSNADDFPSAVYIGERDIDIGDSYSDGRFYRDGVELLTDADALNIIMGGDNE